MNIKEFQKNEIKKQLGFDDEKFSNVFMFIDFGNVNKWFDGDKKFKNRIIEKNQKISIDLEKLKQFTDYFSEHIRFYYGHDQNSLKFLGKAKYVFGENKVFTKSIQKIKHYLKDNEIKKTTRDIHKDQGGYFVYLPKCNFDVEICVDSIRLMEKYDTFCIFSGDSDFIALIEYLKHNHKKIILVKSGHVQNTLIKNSDLVINAQDIKFHISFVNKAKI